MQGVQNLPILPQYVALHQSLEMSPWRHSAAVDSYLPLMYRFAIPFNRVYNHSCNVRY
jgi:hypothetical protein